MGEQGDSLGSVHPVPEVELPLGRQLAQEGSMGSLRGVQLRAALSC